MQPVKGGTLANIPAEAVEILKAANPNLSPASWAIRFGASLDGVITVLSGMSSLAQVNDNISYMKDFTPLTDAEKDMLVNQIVPIIKRSGPFKTADFSKYEGIADNGMPVAAMLDAYNSCMIQPDPTYSTENNYYKTFRLDAKIPAGQSWISGKLIDKDGNDVTETVRKVEKWLMDNTF